MQFYIKGDAAQANSERMGKPKIPSQKKAYSELNKRLAKYVAKVQAIYDSLSDRVALNVETLDYDGSVPFSFGDYPETRELVKTIQSQFVSDIGSLIYRGTSDEWKRSNAMQDLLADKVLKYYDAEIHGEKRRVYYQDNNDALKAFQQRKRGLNLSTKLWRQSEAYKKEMECAISTAIEKGTSAITLSKRLSQYLKDFPSMQRDYKEKFGIAADCNDCEYRSIRLARSEINMAYRTAEQKRWQQFDFIQGYEIKLSKAHKTDDVCDDLKGKYPKNFVWTGWHPNDMCYAIPIIISEEDYWNKNRSDEVVSDVPNGFKGYVMRNKEKIENADKKGTLPFFLRDNKERVKSIHTTIDAALKELLQKASHNGDMIQSLAENIAKKYGGYVTPINYKSETSIKRKIASDKCTPYDIKDTVSTTIIVPKDKIGSVVKELQASRYFGRYKEQQPVKFCGYSGNIVNLNMYNGIVSEIQVNTAKMIYAKELPENAKKILGEEIWKAISDEVCLEGGLGHQYYEKIRVLDKLNNERVRLEKLSEEYYSHFR